jgi:hypothetical protein
MRKTLIFVLFIIGIKPRPLGGILVVCYAGQTARHNTFLQNASIFEAQGVGHKDQGVECVLSKSPMPSPPISGK